MNNMTPEVERSLAIVLRSVLEHTKPKSPLAWHAELVENWLAKQGEQNGRVKVNVIGGTCYAPPALGWEADTHSCANDR